MGTQNTGGMVDMVDMVLDIMVGGILITLQLITTCRRMTGVIIMAIIMAITIMVIITDSKTRESLVVMTKGSPFV
ncbi:MAG: hypothetical protein P4L49_18485 [Desulfosporosinus sp.]|nr:hypothetical protein [Desulfosporosinus sp.]